MDTSQKMYKILVNATNNGKTVQFNLFVTSDKSINSESFADDRRNALKELKAKLREIVEMITIINSPKSEIVYEKTEIVQIEEMKENAISDIIGNISIVND